MDTNKEDSIKTLQKEIVEDLWTIRGYLYNTISELEKKIKLLEKAGKPC